MSPLRVGIACFSTFGGSGVIATEVATSLVRRGHLVHLFSDEVPGRLAGGRQGAGEGAVVFHPVEVGDFPQLKYPPYTLALTSKIVEVSRRERLDLVHAHYAVPHAASAYLARQVIAAEGAVAPPRIVTTLHGTDITLVGSDASFLPLTRFSIMASDAVTVPSAWLREATFAALDVPRGVAIDVVPNFVDVGRFAPAASREGRDGGGGPVIVHVSNFRPLKRVDDVVRVFARVRAAAAGAGAVLRLVGDGPERPRAAALARELGVDGSLEMLGERADLPALLRGARAFLLPSATESFGLAALEAMACGVPVVASAVGGVPEVVEEGVSGFLRPAGDVAGMADAVLRLVADGALAARMSAAARHRAETAFRREPAVDRYVEIYRRVLGA